MQRQAQQGLGKPIVSAEVAGHRGVAVGNKVYFGKEWKTFPDFLIHFAGNVMGQEWGKAELQKSEAEMHPVALWYRRLCFIQKNYAKKPGEIFTAPDTGASRAYLDLPYNLYSLDHNAELRAVLISRLKRCVAPIPSAKSHSAAER